MTLFSLTPGARRTREALHQSHREGLRPYDHRPRTAGNRLRRRPSAVLFERNLAVVFSQEI